MSGTAPVVRPVVTRNDTSVLRPAPVGSAWVPRLSTSVVVPSYGGQDKLDVVLASLAGQSYPAHLVEVVVVDDGSQPPLHLPELRPERTRLEPVRDGWGIANATSVGVAAADGAVVLRLDNDMLVHREHVEAHLRWHHETDHAVVMGAKQFVDVTGGLPAPPDVLAAVRGGRAAELFDLDESHPHEWIERVLGRTDDLRSATWDAHRISVGASISAPAGLHAVTGGMHARLRLGSDSEWGYRLAQAGAVFVYERAAQAWHLGISSVMKDRPAALRYRLPFIVDEMARPRYRRAAAGRQYAVPYAEVVVPVGGAALRDVVTTADRVLDNDDADLVLRLLVARTSPEVAERLRAMYASEPRVSLVAELAPTAYPSAFRIAVEPGVEVGPSALASIAARADRLDVALLTVAGGRGVRAERTAAYARAHLLAGPDDDLDALAVAIGGAAEVEGDVVDVPVPGQPPRDWVAHRDAARTDAKALLAQVKRARADAEQRSVRGELRRRASVAKKQALRVRSRAGRLLDRD